jgi:AraC-like DNA-binding protein
MIQRSRNIENTTFFLIVFVLIVAMQLSNFGAVVSGQNLSSQPQDIISNYTQLSSKQLFETANNYVVKNKIDTALIYYNLFINNASINPDTGIQKRLIAAHLNSAFVYYYLCDYSSSYKSLIEALFLCEQYKNTYYKSSIYTNIGNIYSHYNENDMAKKYYLKALSSCQNTQFIIPILNNLGSIEIKSKKRESALSFLNKALLISKQHNDFNLHSILNNMALFYQSVKQYDSAFYYNRLTLENVKKESKNVKKDNKIEVEAESLSNIGKLFFEINKIDSALFYVHLSNVVAVKNNFSTILVENYLTLSQIEKSKGHILNAFEYYKKYADLKDSVFNVRNFGEINQLQRLYEVSKTNQKIERLAMEQKIKERTIHYQKIIQYVTLGVLLLVTTILLYIFYQKRNLNTAYKILFEKNLEIINLRTNIPENNPKKYETSSLTDNLQNELLNRIIILMENTSIICDTEFTIEKLATLLQSNQRYVSQVINDTLKKNFRSFLNSYRIREAQRLFLELDITKYTVESIAFQVGFKSPSAFRHAFKEITGVSPNFYFKALQESAK